MKTILTIFLFFTIASIPWADEWESYDFETHELVERLVTLPGHGAPVIFKNSVIFTMPSNLRKAGVAFAHENFSQIHWYRQLVVPYDRKDAPIPPGKKEPEPYIDSGIQFYVFNIPENMNELEYRLIINGLWITDPTNSVIRRDSATGLSMSVLSVPLRKIKPNPLRGLPEGLQFTFSGPPGEIISVAGNFNNWDPFMYELKERPAGIYSITIPLPPGTYQYVFFYRGQRFPDPNNPQRVYGRDGSAASVTVIQ